MINKGAEMQMCFDKPILTHSNFGMVVDLSCCVIIKECNKFQPDYEKNNYPEHPDSLLTMLNVNVNWAQHGFINAIQSHVEIIYAYQKAVIDSQKQKIFMICPEYNEALLIVRALDAYQKWKDKIVERGYEIHGKGWGDAWEFNSAKWNENNIEFLALYQKKEE